MDFTKFIELRASSFVGGGISSGFFKPSSVNLECPNCGRAANFGFGNSKLDPTFRTLVHSISCNSCAENVKFFGVYEGEKGHDSRYPFRLFVLAGKKSYLSKPDFSGQIPDSLNRSFLGAVDAYNSDNYAAATVMGRRTLEGIFKFLVAPDKQDLSLYKLIEEAQNSTDFSGPLRRLSAAIRTGGNLGAHFDLEREPDVEMARQIIELLQYFIEYLYVLPKQIDELEDRLSQ